MFETLTTRIDKLLRQLSGVGKITEQNVAEVLREVRLIFLEADVNFNVARDFIAQVKQQALGAAVLSSVTPGQQMTKIIYDEMVRLLGAEASEVTIRSDRLNVILLAGLQGAGKTTAATKLALYFKKKGHQPLLAAADLSRPAAVEQLVVNGRNAGLPVFFAPGTKDIVVLAAQACQEARNTGRNVLIIDTAGRLHVDDGLMDELTRLKAAVTPTETLLVVDGMSGQDILTVAQAFRARLDYDGFILTKLDGDTRGGAALSVRAVTGRPIKFISTGEGAGQFEVFHPARIASRILGKGDIVGLVERAQESADEDTSRRLEEKLRKNQFTLADFLEQLRQMKKMGPLSSLLEMMPGMGGAARQMGDSGEASLKRVEAIICSMTPTERARPTVIDGSRRRRIAQGSGTSVPEVNQLLKQFQSLEKMFKMFGKGGGLKRSMPFPLMR